MSDFSKLKASKNGKEYILNVCTQDTEQNIIGTKNFTKLTVNSKNVVTSINGLPASEDGNVQLGNIGAITGKIEWFAFNEAPNGYLVCNGANVSRETYADLFAVIGTTYGSGDGSTTFALPNLIDKFAQGSTTVGTVKSAGLPNITGSLASRPVGNSNDTTGAFVRSRSIHSNLQANVSSTGFSSDLSFNASRSSSIYGNSSTVQPPALTLLPCIKF